jgi:hypothetical protein
MVNNLWKYFFKRAGFQPETIAEVEKILWLQVNGRYN